MTVLRNNIYKGSYLIIAIAFIGSWLTGCSTEPPTTSTVQAEETTHGNDPLRVGDIITIDFAGPPQPIKSVGPTDIKGDGTVHLDLIGDVQCAGLTPGELEKVIQKKYVPDYYTHLSVTVTPTARYFYVEGEVNGGTGGGRILYSGPITVTRAIAAAGDFSPFADKKRVKLYRVNATKAITINCVKALDHPELDLPVYPGDKIVVRRRLY